jgi:hypothetical protein
MFNLNAVYTAVWSNSLEWEWSDNVLIDSDLVFILDCTGSMQRYINSVRDHIAGICDMIRGEEGLGGPDDLRVGVSLRSLTAVHIGSLAPGLDTRQTSRLGCNRMSGEVGRREEAIKDRAEGQGYG